MDNKIFGKNLKFLRKNKGYTQQVLAELVGIDEKHLSRLEIFSNIHNIKQIIKCS